MCSLTAMKPAEFVEHIESDGKALIAAAERKPSADVAGCPGWDAARLARHMGGVHQWAGKLVADRATEPISRKDLPAAPEDHEALFAWCRDKLTGVVSALKAANPEEPVWNFTGADQRAGFWHRRQAQETTVHRWDAQSAVGAPDPIDAALAIDGIDEYLSVIVPLLLSLKPVQSLAGSVHLHATDFEGSSDVEGEWLINLHPDRMEQRREHAKGDAAIRGPASDLLLFLWNRRGLDDPDLELFGDRKVAEQFRSFGI